MKRWPWAIALIALLTTSCIIMVPDRDWSNPRTEPDDQYAYRYDTYRDTGLNTGYFYDYLAPYGTWISYSGHGYVWIPRSMGYRWRPYTHGHWIWTNHGWTWISDHEWGWAVFHYGRWGYDDRLGWFWVPGTVWGPAWVVWRSSDLYFGWAPLPPGVEWRPRYGFGGPFDVPDHYWIFVEGRYFMREGLHGYALPHERNRTIVRMSELKQNIRFRNDDVVNEGIDREVVRRVTRDSLNTYDLRNADRPGRDRIGLREATLYRPEVKVDEKAVPKKFVERDKADPSVIRDPVENEQIIRRRHDEENKILERTQDEEVRDINRRFQEKSAAAKEQAERAKLKKDQDAQVQELKKKHDEEKAQVQERQKKDTEIVRKGAIKKVEKKVEK